MTPETLAFRERSITFTLDQLLGDEWALDLRYRISQATLSDRFTGIPSGAMAAGGFQPERQLEAVLQQWQITGIYNHPSGLFARAGGIWTAQSNQGYVPDRPGDDFWQFNVEGGWRFARRRAELRLALLNLNDRQYRLNPLNLTLDLPRERTLALSLRLDF